MQNPYREEMPFNKEQQSYKQFREILKQRTTPVLVFSGAGLSTPAKLPLWSKLYSELHSLADQKALEASEEHRKVVSAHLSLAIAEDSLWAKFDHLKKAFGNASYVAAVRQQFQSAARADIPDGYINLWKLGINGFINLNIDRLATRAHTFQFPGKSLREFNGIDANRHYDCLLDSHPFVMNVHGNLDDVESWVFTQSEFSNLASMPGYKKLIDACFASRIVVFIGMSADDQAAGGHLEELKRYGINLSKHFWITDRNDLKTVTWAENLGIQIINYKSSKDDHRELDELFHDLETYVPVEIDAPPVNPKSNSLTAGLTPIATTAEVERKSAEEIRNILNSEAKRILASNAATRISDYDGFWRTFSEAIYRAWSVDTDDGHNQFFAYRLKREIAGGSFGRVYEAENESGKKVAVKVLNVDIRRDKARLACFRRGVQSMQILSQRGIAGMVPYHEAFEIPTSIIMEYVDGLNLEEYSFAGYLSEWRNKVILMKNLSAIIKGAHSVPERVLHRDIRPANIMLRDAHKTVNPPEVVVLDFDLSWFRDAQEGSLNLSSSSNGYLSPEQAEPKRRKLARNALVDSYGLGMTCYFIVGGQHPPVGLSRYSDWPEILKRLIKSHPCDYWKSLPYRVARLISFSTKHEQSERWDVSRINGELSFLDLAAKGPESIPSAAMLAEEIAAHCCTNGSEYVWNEDRLSAIFEFRSGFTVTFQGDESFKKIQLTIEWLHTGDSKFESIRKYIGEAAEKSSVALKKGRWSVDLKQISTGQARIEASMLVSHVRNTASLSRASDSVNEALEALRRLR